MRLCPQTHRDCASLSSGRVTTAIGRAHGWRVLLLGGASPVGKTSVSHELARHFGVSLVEVADFQAVLERMTTPEEQPELDFFLTRREEWRQVDEEGRLANALEPVIANHLEGPRCSIPRRSPGSRDPPC
jgi:hypothetical protein